MSQNLAKFIEELILPLIFVYKYLNIRNKTIHILSKLITTGVFLEHICGVTFAVNTCVVLRLKSNKFSKHSSKLEIGILSNKRYRDVQFLIIPCTCFPE